MRTILKRIATPNSWSTARKASKFIVRPSAGAHSFTNGLSLAVALRDLLGICHTVREVKLVLNAGQVLVDGVARKDPKHIVGLFDVISVGEKSYRVIFDVKGRLVIVPVDDAGTKLVQVTGKGSVKKGKNQIRFHDGSTTLSDEKVSVGDSVVLSLPDRKVKKVLPFRKGVSVFLKGGSHIGLFVVIDEVIGDLVVCRHGSKLVKTRKAYAVVDGGKDV